MLSDWLKRFKRRNDAQPYTGAAASEPKPIKALEDVEPPAAVSEHGYSGRQAAEIVGITFRQLDYWARTDLIRPSLVDAAGEGSRRKYSYRDLLELKVIKNLLDAGVRLESVREAFAYLRDNLGEDVSSVNLVISGHQSVLVRTGEDIVDLLRQGQGVLNILPLAGVKDEVDAAILQFPRAGAQSNPQAEPPADFVERPEDPQAASGPPG